MARRGIAILVVGIAVFAGVSAWVNAQSGRSAVEGAWALQDYSYAKTATVRLNKPIGMLLFTGTHYSFVILRDSSPRPDVGAEGLKATAEDMRASWGPLQAQAGIFDIKANLLTFRATVSKGLQAMATGAYMENTFRVNGDTLTLVSTRTNAGPLPNARTWRFTRAK